MYIAIAGNIGSGKTSLTEILTEHYKATAYFEDSNNPYIGDFYEDMNRWSFNLQVYFLGAKINQQVAMLDTEGDIIQDRTIYEDAHIFASNLHQMGLMSSRRFDRLFSEADATGNFTTRPDVARGIIDWADADDQMFSPEGASAAEDYKYDARADRYRAHDNSFDSIEELKMVRGVSDGFMEAFGPGR
jgi:hypothetical protein